MLNGTDEITFRLTLPTLKLVLFNDNRHYKYHVLSASSPFSIFLRCKNNFTDFYILIDIAYLVCFHSVKINVWTHYDTIAWSCYFWNRALLVKAFIYKHFVTIGSIIILENVLFMLFEVLCFPLHFRKLHMTHCFYLVVLRTWDFKKS